MDELEISGKRYISTRLAGKEHKYHSDYIGQLIRGGKVVGQKVGRSWYVEAESLAAYLGQETSASAPAPKMKVERVVKQPRAKTPAPALVEMLVEPEVSEEPEETEEEISTPPEDSEQEIEEPVLMTFPAPGKLMPRPLQMDMKHSSAKRHELKAAPAKKITQRETRIEERTEEEEHVRLTLISTPPLRYISDEKPAAFPEIREQESATRHTEEEVQPFRTSPAATLRSEQAVKRGFRARLLLPVLTVLVIGCLVFVLAAMLSAYLISTTTIKNGEAASTNYSLSLH